MARRSDIYPVEGFRTLQPRGVVAKHAGLWSRRQRFESARGYSTENCTFLPRVPPCPVDHRDLDELNQAFASELIAFPLPPPKRKRETTHSTPFSPPPPSLEPSPVLVVCSTCRQSIRLNETFRVPYCPTHGLGGPFTFIPLRQKRLPGARNVPDAHRAPQGVPCALNLGPQPSKTGPAGTRRARNTFLIEPTQRPSPGEHRHRAAGRDSGSIRRPPETLPGATP